MNKIFLAYPFRKENEQLAQAIDRLVKSHGLALVTGEILGGEGLTPAIKDRIAKSDALIALLARDQKIRGKEEWTATEWVKTELGEARHRSQRAIAIVEKGVKHGGLYQGHQYISLERDKFHEALLRLSETIGLWKEEAGGFLDVRLRPDDAAAAALTETIKCRYRLIRRSAAAGDWKETQVHKTPGGVFVDIAGVRRDENIQIELMEGGQAKWRSIEWPQWVHVELERAP